jgi:maleate isomerase
VMMSTYKRIGMIVPSSNVVVEPVTTAMLWGLYPQVSAHYTRIEVKTISLDEDSRAHFELDPMLRAAVLLADAGMDAIAWNGTSATWLGLEADRALCDAITRATGVPATTSALAQVEAFRAYGVRSYGLAVPYLDSVRQAIIRTYQDVGFPCVSSHWLGISTNRTFADIEPPMIRDLVRRSDSPRAEAIAVICTNLPAAWLVEELEAELGKPIFDSTVLAVWHGLRLAGWNKPLDGWGRLLRELAGLAGQTP